MRKLLVGIGWFLSCFGPANDLSTYPPKIKNIAFHVGDSSRWAQPNFDDDAWERVPLRNLRFFKENLWIRVWIEVPELSHERPWGLYLSGLFSAEIFWNGQRIGAKGIVGINAETERPGPMDSVIFLPPDMMAPGRYLLALRLSSHHMQTDFRQPIHGLYFSEYKSFRRSILGHYLPALTTLSALLLAAIYFAGRFIRNRHERSLRWLVLLCLAVVIQLLAESWRGLVSYSYDWHLIRLQVVMGCAYVIGLALIAYIGCRLVLNHWKRYAMAGFFLAVCLTFLDERYDAKTAIVLFVFSLIASSLTIGGLWLKKKDASWVLLGVSLLTVCIFFSQALSLDRYLYLGFLGFLITLFMVEINALSQITKARWVAETTSQRLELELIKKQIQPHFLMNTLTSLAEWFDSEPRTASAMVESIAEVYRLLLQVAHHRLIPLTKEVELCEAYLKVMGYRRDHQYSLEVSGQRMEDSIPPAVLLTLLENALTHNAYGSSKIHFRFHVDHERKHLTRMTLISPLGLEVPDPEKDSVIQQGTGTAYIRARLKEAFPAGWSFSDGATGGNQWHATIEVQTS